KLALQDRCRPELPILGRASSIMSGLLERIARRRRATASSRLGPPPGSASTVVNGSGQNGSTGHASPRAAIPAAPPPGTTPPLAAPPAPGNGAVPATDAAERENHSDAELALMRHAEALATQAALAEIEALREPQERPEPEEQ